MFSSLSKKSLIPWLVFLLALVLRLAWLGEHPLSLNRDEAAIGWNAYSVLKTGKDEWGRVLPFSFKSFGDYKMPLYIYLTVPLVYLLGLSELAVRLASALAGSLTVLLVYFLVKKLFEQEEGLNLFGLGVVSSLILALNPWHLFYSRVGFEANFCLFLITAATVFFVYRSEKWWFWPLAGLCFGLAFYAYSSAYVFLPVFLLSLAGLNYRTVFKRRHWPLVLVSGLIFLVLSVHAAWASWSVSQAKKSITIFSDPGVIDWFNHQRAALFRQSPFLARLWLNKPFYFFRLAGLNYLKTFSFKFLLASGGEHPWHSIPGFGNFYYLALPFMLIGFYWLFKLKSKSKWLVLGWLLTAPLASAITVDAPHSTRSLPMVVPMVVIIALGIVKGAGAGQRFLGELGQSRFWGKGDSRAGLVLAVVLAGWLLMAGRYLYSYFYIYPKKMPSNLMVGLKEALLFVEASQAVEAEEKAKPEKVFMLNPPDSPYIYTLFHLKPDPQKFIDTVEHYGPGIDQMEHVRAYEGFEFLYHLPEEKKAGYYIIRPRDCWDESKIIKRVEDQQGGTVFVVCRI